MSQPNSIKLKPWLPSERLTLQQFIDEGYVLIARHWNDPLKDRDITNDVEELLNTYADPQGTKECPVCGEDSPHNHSERAVREYRFAQGVRFGCGCCATGNTREPSQLLKLSDFPKKDGEVKAKWCNCACHDVADYDSGDEWEAMQQHQQEYES